MFFSVLSGSFILLLFLPPAYFFPHFTSVTALPPSYHHLHPFVRLISVINLKLNSWLKVTPPWLVVKRTEITLETHKPTQGLWCLHSHTHTDTHIHKPYAMHVDWANPTKPRKSWLSYLKFDPIRNRGFGRLLEGLRFYQSYYKKRETTLRIINRSYLNNIEVWPIHTTKRTNICFKTIPRKMRPVMMLHWSKWSLQLHWNLQFKYDQYLYPYRFVHTLSHTFV